MLQHPLEGFKGSRHDNYSDIFVFSYLLLHDIPSVKFILVYTCVLYIKYYSWLNFLILDELHLPALHE